MSYEIHVGDYVKTIGGFVGWISNIKDNNYIVITDENNNSCGYHLPQEDRYFVRIGAYDFTKKEKKKVARLSEDDSWLTFRNTNKANVNLCYIIKRINELVDAVNLLLDKSTES